MLDNTLIEKALSLTGKTIKDVEQEVPMPYEDYTMDEFYIEKFCYYLLSPEFLEKYTDL